MEKIRYGLIGRLIFASFRSGGELQDAANSNAAKPKNRGLF
jgi:hypothetical protein